MTLRIDTTDSYTNRHRQVTVKSSHVMSCYSHCMYRSILMSQSRQSEVRVKSLSSYNVKAAVFNIEITFALLAVFAEKSYSGLKLRTLRPCQGQGRASRSLKFSSLVHLIAI